MRFSFLKSVSLIGFLILIQGCGFEVKSQTNQVLTPVISNKKIVEAKRFTRANKMDTTIAIFVDMSIHSGKYRMFVWSFELEKIINSSLCAHGSCDASFYSEEVRFSNVSESHCSSVGKYKIGKRGYSNWGTHFNYKLHGLEKTNNNAYKRVIVLHSFEQVEDTEVYPEHTMDSWGCPMVSNNTLIYLDTVLKKVKQPVLLWLYK